MLNYYLVVFNGIGEDDIELLLQMDRDQAFMAFQVAKAMESDIRVAAVFEAGDAVAKCLTGDLGPSMLAGALKRIADMEARAAYNPIELALVKLRELMDVWRHERDLYRDTDHEVIAAYFVGGFHALGEFHNELIRMRDES